MVDTFYDEWSGNDVTEYKDWTQKEKDEYNKRVTEDKRLDIEIPKVNNILNKLNNEAKQYRQEHECD